MPFKKLFGRGNGGQPAPETPADAADESIDPAADDFGEDLAPETVLEDDALDRDWRERAALVIAGGTSTGSKRPAALYGPESDEGPAHYTSASGCRVVTASGRTLIDCTMALGSVAIGYGDDAITRAVINVAANGNVAGLASTLEVEVAERLIDIIPCAEQMRFMKSGAEAVSVAVRVARAATGRNHVVGSGYFGWHDWWSTGPGIPPGANADFSAVPFDDVPALERAARAAGRDLAAIILEPVVERLPSPEWAVAARRLCDELGAVLIFDEMKTGFRIALGGYQEYAKVDPDVATLGKAMANGFPIAVVAGRTGVMEALDRTWVSSTLAGEGIGLAAVQAVLEVHEQMPVCDTLWRVGGELRDGVARAVDASRVQGVRVHGIEPMWSIAFEDETVQRHFLERAASHGVLFKRGAYNYAALAHDHEQTIEEVERVASTVFVELMEEGVA